MMLVNAARQRDGQFPSLENAKMEIKVGYNEGLNLVLPDGRHVSVEISWIDDDQWPEIDIYLPETMSANCFGDGLTKAVVFGEHHQLLARQITIPYLPTVMPKDGECDETNDFPGRRL